MSIDDTILSIVSKLYPQLYEDIYLCVNRRTRRTTMYYQEEYTVQLYLILDGTCVVLKSTRASDSEDAKSTLLNHIIQDMQNGLEVIPKEVMGS
jgi:hypothetical protein